MVIATIFMNSNLWILVERRATTMIEGVISKQNTSMDLTVVREQLEQVQRGSIQCELSNLVIDIVKSHYCGI
jgi:hypothetical protein